ncbi:hypothetical protein VTI74DRAFT_7619 [Chaetomium olivicolor]
MYQFMRLLANILFVTAFVFGWESNSNTSSLRAHDFEDGNLGPFTPCNVKPPSFASATSGVTFEGKQKLEVFFDEAGYDGTRNDRGSEICVFVPGTSTNIPQVNKEGWQGFAFYVPSSFFPDNKSTAIAQQFCPGGCSSWAGTIEILGNQLIVNHRAACIEPIQTVLVDSLSRDEWHTIVIHVRVSRQKRGVYEVWLDGEQVYSATGIHFAFGDWIEDVLLSGLYFKNGLYAHDVENHNGGKRTPCHAIIADIPSVLGPVYPLMPKSPAGDNSRFLKSRPSDFIHPGIWHTHDDLERMKKGVLDGEEPWGSTFAAFREDSFSQATYKMKGPKEVISRGRSSNYSAFTSDVRAAWQNALMWYITKDEAQRNVTTSILDGWGSTLVDIIGTDRSLLVGLEGDLFVNAAEIIRYEGNWTEAGARWQGGTGFSNQLYWLFSRQSVVIGQANYGMASIKALLSFAVYLDVVTLYNYAINEYLNNPCAGLYSMFEPTTGQSSESGRDQSAEYTAKFNLNETVPYDPKWFRCEAILVDGPWDTISRERFGVTPSNPMWDIVYYEYTVKRGKKAPWTTKAKATEGPEGRLEGADHPSWGGLIWGAKKRS